MAKFEKGKSGNPSARFEKGKSGNPGGRPKSNLSALLSRLVQRDENGKRTELEIVKKVCKLALAGDMKAIEFIWERLEGKVTSPITLNEDAPVRFTLDLGVGKGG
ncbi:MAG: DUF5681 domain-containing protein [Elusimicrobiota bacterium]|jgi:hypothetical protein